MNRSPRRDKLRSLALFPAFTAVIGMAACGGDSTPKNQPDSAAASTSAGCENQQDPNAAVQKTAEGIVRITFDTLCSDPNRGGSNYINTYPSPGPEGTVSNGSFEDGQQADADCKETGRPIPSHKDQGEIDTPTSSDWVHLNGVNQAQFATAMYIENRVAVLAALPECK